jgi:outer membrane receptor protein involved in Fe transport|nr:iron complex outerrane recepter protein [Phenylobacterium sp.]
MTPQTNNHLRAKDARRRVVAASGVALALACAAAAPGAAHAADTRLFHLPAEPLESALVRFALQGGVSVGGLPVRGCSGPSRAVSGTMTPARALAALLPPGCRFEPLDSKSFRITGRPTPVATTPPRRLETESYVAPRLDELVVTAEKRPEFLTRSASAVGVLSGDDLLALGGKSFDEVAAQVVGVAVTNLGSGRNKIFVRGISDGAFTGKTQSTVGLYLDDVPITYNAPDPDLRLADIDRVEVLRGPQGTLYGSGSIGGIVRIVTAKPDVTAFYGEVSAEGKLTQHGDPSSGAEAMANMPLADGRAAVRAVVYSDARGGYIDNPVLRLRDVNYSRRSGGRIAALVDLPEGWRLEGGVAHQSIATADSQYTQGPDGPLTRDAAVREPHNNDFSEIGITALHAGAGADLKVSTAFIDHHLATRYDATDAFRAAGGSRTGGAFDEDKRIKLWATEALLSSNGSGPLRWLAGAFVSYTDEMDAAKLVGVSPPEPARSIYRRHDQLSEAAAYGEVAYDLTPRLTATAGARWFVTRVQTNAGAFDIALAPLAPVRGQLTDQGLAPKLRLSFAVTPDVVVYAQVAEGYRAGGFNIPARAGGGATEPLAARFRPDHLWSYELGAALPLFDKSVILRAALFHADWRDLQTDQRLASGLPMTVNIGNGSNTGLEGEAVWRPNAKLQVRANVLLEDPQINRAFDVFPARRDIGLPGVPYAMGAADVRYRWRLGRFDAETSAQVVYVGRSFLTFDGGAGNSMGGYASGRVAAALGTAAWRATAYVDNVTDEAGNTFAYGNPFSRARATQATPLRPRTFGMGVTRRF